MFLIPSMLVAISVCMSLFVFFHARHIFYRSHNGADRFIYLLLMLVCLIFCWLKRQDMMLDTPSVYPWPAIFYSVYNIAIFVIILYVTWLKNDI